MTDASPAAPRTGATPLALDIPAVLTGPDMVVRWAAGERLHHLFEARVDAAGDGDGLSPLAVDGPSGQLNFRELDERANRLARYLLARGVRSGDRVALLFDRTAESYVAWLAVLKAHAAYVPLDPAFPPDRIAYILSDAEVTLVLTRSTWAAGLETRGIACVDVDSEASAIALMEPRRIGFDDVGEPTSELAYIIYTSGSTGRPKGVPIDHAAICNFVRVAAETYGYRAGDRVYQGLTLAFDFAVEEVLVPLVAGATLIPPGDGLPLVGDCLAAFLREHDVTAMCCVPTVLATIADPLPRLRLLILSGEACPANLAARWHAPERLIFNAYGPTETTVTCTVAVVEPERALTIGRPLATYAVVILAPGETRALPAGEVGEIAVGGIGVAAGYLNRPEQTARAFVEDILDLPGNLSGRIYRTGDMGRITDAGELEYLGRIDTQVKVRGYRIEVTEIESVMLDFPAVAQAVVKTVDTANGPELVAYYTRTDDAAVSEEAMALWLREKLPAFMTPAYFQRLDEMPLLPSGKADRKALPEPDLTRVRLRTHPFEPPADDLEATVAAVVGEVLGLDEVSATDHLLSDLGANSLSLARITARLRERAGVHQLGLRAVYTAPTVRGLAAAIRAHEETATPAAEARPIHRPSDLAWFGSAAAQAAISFLMLLLGSAVLIESLRFQFAATSLADAYGRALLVGTLVFAGTALLPIAAKWLLIGRFKPTTFEVWGWRYLRFWFVKSLMTANPMVLFAGSPLYNAYLKALGARVSWTAVLLSARPPTATDLVTIGDHAVVTAQAVIPGYRAEGNRITLDALAIGANAYVGEGSIVEIDTVIEDGAQLGHASTAQQGQRLKAGKSYHGTPAVETTTQFRRVPTQSISMLRRLIYPMAQLLLAIVVFAPAAFLTAYALGHGLTHVVEPNVPAEAIRPRTILSHIEIIIAGTVAALLVSLVVGLALLIAIPRLLRPCIRPGKIYPLFGVTYFVAKWMRSASNSRFFNQLFGDSSFVLPYLAKVGYRFPNPVNTGSNFGIVQTHDHPFLCTFGRGTMVADALFMTNMETSSTHFRVSPTRLGTCSFIGNYVYMLPDAKLGDNVLLGNKLMVPIDGEVRSNVGLLGSPPIEIPRQGTDHGGLDPAEVEALRAERLPHKDRSNLRTMLFFLMTRWSIAVASLAVLPLVGRAFGGWSPLALACAAFCALVTGLALYMFVDWLSRGRKPLQPRTCSIYDPYFWTHERHWKVGAYEVVGVLNGTPFKSWAWRALGVKIGRKVFDAGAGMSEKTLVEIGDYCTLDERSYLQCHGLEDGAFKSDRIVVGAGCSLGALAFVHYGADIGDGAKVEANAFVMKGQRVLPGAQWAGNPAGQV